MTIAGWINRQQEDVIAYIQEENRILTSRLKGLSASEIMSSVANTPVRRPTEFIPDFPPTWERVLLKALAKDPDSRYPSAVEFGAALVKCAADEQ